MEVVHNLVGIGMRNSGDKLASLHKAAMPPSYSNHVN